MQHLDTKNKIEGTHSIRKSLTGGSEQEAHAKQNLLFKIADRLFEQNKSLMDILNK